MLTKPTVPHVYLSYWVNARLALCLNSVLNVKTLGAFNQEKALVGAFSMIVQINCETDGSFYSTSLHTLEAGCPVTAPDESVGRGDGVEVGLLPVVHCHRKIKC